MIGRYRILSLMICLIVFYVAGCKSAKDSTTGTESEGGEEATIRAEGSDTMVNLAQAWAETYHGKQGHVKIQVLGGGSGVGVAMDPPAMMSIGDRVRIEVEGIGTIENEVVAEPR